jgi:hypothetical protein
MRNDVHPYSKLVTKAEHWKRPDVGRVAKCDDQRQEGSVYLELGHIASSYLAGPAGADAVAIPARSTVKVEGSAIRLFHFNAPQAAPNGSHVLGRR